MDERMQAVAPAWEKVREAFDTALAGAAHAERSRVTKDLNAICRRLRQYESEEQWLNALRDGLLLGSQRFAVFTLSEGMARLRQEHGILGPEPIEFPVSSARSFVEAAESRDQVIALRTVGEVGERLSSSETSNRAHLFPIANGKRTVAIVFACADDSFDVSTTELITGVAATVLERQSNQTLHAQIAPQVSTGPRRHETLPQPVSRSLPSWVKLNEKERIIHARAQRFSRLSVADLQLRRPEACRAGRKQNNIYMFLQTDIDKARETYSKQFMTIPSMVDYLHLELVKIAAEGDETKLGVEYPGHLV